MTATVPTEKSMKLILILAGKFLMGSPNAEK